MPDVDASVQERDALRETVRTLFERTSTEADVRRTMETEQGYDDAVWRQLSEQVGLTGLAVPEEYDGAGYGAEELAVVFEEAGRSLLCAPLLSTVGLATPLLLASGDDALKKEWLPRIAAGAAFATLALTEQSSSWDPAAVTTTAVRDGAGWRLDGQKWFVLDGGIADLVLVVARTDSHVAVFAVDGQAEGLVREPMVTMDATRKMSRLTLTGVPAQLVGAEAAGAEVLAKALQLGAVALSAENLGGAQKCLDLAAAYAKERVQFGRPIGSFQAVKHKLADMLVEVEQARSASYYAAREAATGSDGLPLAASLAKAYTGDAFVHAALTTVQVHGGIGFTWEHPAHLYVKRAKTSQLLLGSSTHHRAVVADRVGI